MIARSLQQQLEPVARRYRRWRLWRGLALCWLIAALLGGGLLLLHRQTGWGSSRLAVWLGAAAGIAAVVVGRRLQQWQPDWHLIARQIEAQNPELQALLLTAVEQKPDARTGQFSYLQDRLILAAFRQGCRQNWGTMIPNRRLFGMQLAQWAALALFVVCLAKLPTLESGPTEVILARGVTITPGDTTVERGSGLVVLARFSGRIPAEVALVIGSSSADNPRVPLAKNLADPEFGGSLTDVQSNLVYHVEYGGQRTRDYTVRVFEYPRLERMDAQITYPSYTGLPEKRIEDTRRVSAVEGSRLELACQLNKPVVSAKLVGKDKSIVTLAADPKRAAVALTNFLFAASQAYELQLIDAEGRTNKIPTQLIVAVLSNRPPDIKLLAPKGDQRVSALEELNFRAEVSDDFGVQAFGIAYTLAGKETKTLALGKTTAPLEKRRFNYLLPLEALGASPDQLISYYLWADDFGPDGKIRRTTGDLFFAEVRPFDEIFRQSQSSSGESESANESNESGDQPGSAARLAELQKQIILATWRLQRLEKGPSPSSQYRQDAPVVRQSQEQALTQAREAKSKASDPKAQAGLESAEQAMSQALTHLTKATNSPAALPDALVDEQAAYQALLKLQSREFQVAQARNQRNQRNNRSSARSQQQLQQLEMAASENRYETERQASRPSTPQKTEELQVQNRLKELAQRQQDVNERLKELQTALQEARTEADREEARRRLKRLREEEQQMLADLDELQQRMDRSQNPSRMAETRQRLEQSRSEVRQAAQAMQDEAVPKALTSGVRAERQLQQMRDGLRQQNASQLTDDMRQLRTDARSLSQKQDEVGNQLQELADPKQKTLSQSEQRTGLADQLTQQKKSLTNLLERATEITREAEAAEPLLAKKLYDTLRQSQQDKLDNLLDITTEMLRRSFVPQASQLEQRARQGITSLKNGVEQAAESVLGDETEALRLARKELDDLSRQVEREMNSLQSNSMANLLAGQPPGSTNGASPDSGLRSLLASANSGTNRQNQARSQPNRLDTNTNGTGENAGEGSGQARPDQNRLSQNSPRTPGGNRGQQTPDGNPQTPEPTGDPGQAGSGQDRLSQNSPRTPGGNRGQRTPGRNPQANERTADNGGNWSGTGPITGRDYMSWSDRLRDVEEMLDNPDWRNDVARVRDRAQALRAEYKRLSAPPQPSLIKTQIVAPLAEIRSRIQEELARRENKDGLVPLDRDPVPNRYSEMVRRYYEQLGRDN